MKWKDTELAAAAAEVSLRLRGVSCSVVVVLVRAAAQEVSPMLGSHALADTAILQIEKFRELFRDLS